MIQGTFKKIFKKNHHILKAKKKGFKIAMQELWRILAYIYFSNFLLLKEIAIFS
jgi:hypothetical protein